MSTSELFKKHFGDSPSANLNHPNMESFFNDLNDECIMEDKINALKRMIESGYGRTGNPIPPKRMKKLKDTLSNLEQK